MVGSFLSGTKFVNNSGVPELDIVAQQLNSGAFDWSVLCGFYDGYNDGTASQGGAVAEFTFDPWKGKTSKDKEAGANQEKDYVKLPDGNYKDSIKINTGRTDLKAKDWMGLILHEILHGSRQIDDATGVLSQTFFTEHPDLTDGQKRRTLLMVEEMLVRIRVEQIARDHRGIMNRHDQFDLRNGKGSLNEWLDIYNEADRYPGLEVLPPGEVNALKEFLLNNISPDNTRPCSISLDAPFDSFWDVLRKAFGLAEQTLSPLVLDLDGDGVETLGHDYYINFDHDKNGFAERTGWVAADDGLLVLDRNGNGQIDNGSELFGNNSGGNTGLANGFAALAEFDSNLDGKIDASDTAFASLRVWKDANSNGYADVGELLTLQQAGVGSLSLSYTTGTAVDAQGNSHKQLGSYTTTLGATRQMTDVWFSVDTMRSLDLNLVEVPDDVSALPDIDGSGTVRSLHQAMARDTSGALKALIIAYAAATTDAARAALLPDILYHWTGVLISTQK